MKIEILDGLHELKIPKGIKKARINVARLEQITAIFPEIGKAFFEISGFGLLSLTKFAIGSL